MGKAPAKVDSTATRLTAETTLRAIDVIGKDTADQIRATAASHLERANKLVAMLNTLAEAVETTTKAAAEDLNNYCEHATHVLETVQGLQVRLEAVKKPGLVEEVEKPAKLPVAANLVTA